MRHWALLLGGLLIWAADFFVIYAIAEFIGPRTIGRVLAALAGALSLGGDVLIGIRAARLAAADDYDRWRRSTALLGIALSMIAIVWQRLPVLFGDVE